MFVKPLYYWFLLLLALACGIPGSHAAPIVVRGPVRAPSQSSFTVLAQDDFVRANQLPLSGAGPTSGTWITDDEDADHQMSIASNLLSHPAFDARARVSGPTWTARCVSEVTYNATDTGGVGSGIGPLCHHTDGADTYIRALGNGSGWAIERRVTGSNTGLNSGSGTTFTAGDRLLLDYNTATGAWALEKNGTQFASGTDGSPVATGQAGVAYSSTDTAARVSLWRAGSRP